MSNTVPVKIAMAGCGTVGAAVAEIVVNRREALAARTGLRFEFTSVLVGDASKKRDVPIQSSLITDDPAEFKIADADMLVEVIGGTTRAKDLVLKALSLGKPVVTANKALLAECGREVFGAARAAGSCIAFEASCAGGLPIVGAILRGLTANRNHHIAGIFNSTCNFILTEMLVKGVAYDDALADAQRLGYAEADPTLDVGGGDTAHKLTILASLALEASLDFDKVVMQGIDKLEVADLQIAEQMGYSCKMIGQARRTGDDGVALQVRPMLVAKDNWLAGRSGTDSGVCVDGDAVGRTLYCGAGAGGLPTASAVVADMIDVAAGSTAATFAQLGVYPNQTKCPTYVDPGEIKNGYYVRFSGRPLADVEQACRQAGVTVQSAQAFENDLVAVIVPPIADADLQSSLDKVCSNLTLSTPPVSIAVMVDE